MFPSRSAAARSRNFRDEVKKGLSIAKGSGLAEARCSGVQHGLGRCSPRTRAAPSKQGPHAKPRGWGGGANGGPRSVAIPGVSTQKKGGSRGSAMTPPSNNNSNKHSCIT